MSENAWGYRETSGGLPGADLTGYTMDKRSDEVGSAYIDTHDRKIYLDRTREQMENAPEFDKDWHLGNEDYHRQVGGYHDGPHHL
ncbi:hypothetical protein [Streptomyces sp. NPDC057939]|uniref:hypothetical protein n=1 Tax=Streptomyces sp. NPDC057939 TaxID=3346284 RepID=UPI0036E07A64